MLAYVKGQNLCVRWCQINFYSEQLSTRMGKAGLDIPAVSIYGINVRNSGLLFGLTAFDKPSITSGVEALAKALS